MERTESTVVSVAPDGENEMAKQMALFGWNLHGRQEIIGPLKEAPDPDTLGGAIGRVMLEVEGKKAVVRDHYVKLHFIRSLDMPNLARIKQLESEFGSLPMPAEPGLLWPVLFTAMPIPTVLMMIADPAGKESPGLIGGLLVYTPWMALGVYWVRSRLRKRATAAAAREQSHKRAAEIGQELSSLLDVSNL